MPTPMPERVHDADSTTAVDWNELQFVSWSEFRRMAPSILQLEITRMDALLSVLGADSDSYNHVVRARFCLKRFVTCLEGAARETLEVTCAPHLRAAIVAFSLTPDTLDADARQTRQYVLNRLNYVYRRLPLVY